ncbi:MAG: chromosome segregation protein SMC [Thiotrichales bacterium]|nr:chromosome segregation protein SMC [Thiotrichales bacterium]
MRLRKIRLAGFKSFVDPTTLELPGNIVGVVGPNGCGKSNVIDAVRWVMGEVSARSLRGDTMADVVFNGSRSRQPVSRASVELVFDNLEGRAGGRFAAYNEIAVRRQIVRDGQSSYWLNGTRCRRRDVMDLFHGTGLGPRSYAIIEQGMITRIIEARPDDLRDFLEEAAGISMYKERRRETENRMRHTVENLDRLNDLRDELTRRLAHLKRQATMAEKFRTLEAERRELEAEHLALQWRGLDEQADRDARRVADRQNRLDAALAGQRRVETDLEKARAAHTEAMEAYNHRYRRVIEAGAEVARAEESIQAMRRRREEISGAIREETERVEAARRQIETERREREELAERLAREEPALVELRERSSDARRTLDHCENAVLDVQAELEALSDRERDPARTVHAEQARIQHLESSVEELEARAQALESEYTGLDSEALAREAEPFRRELTEMERELETVEVERTREAVQTLREAVRVAQKALHDEREALGRHRARAASLDALQQEALGTGAGGIADWLEARDLADAPRLAQSMRVAPGWEHAVETVLGACLQAVRTEPFEAVVADAATTLEQGSLTVIDAGAPASGGAVSGEGPVTLRSKVETEWSIAGLLDHVLCATSLEEGLRIRTRLAVGESVVTAQGVWLGPTWMHVSGGGGEEHGVLERERAIEALERDVERAVGEAREREREVDALSRELRESEEAHAAAQGRLNEGHRRAAVLRSELAARTAAAERASERARMLAGELADVVARAGTDREKLAAAREQLGRSSSELSRLAEERARCEERRRGSREQFAIAREQWQQVSDDAHALELGIGAVRSRLGASEEASGRDRRRLEELEERLRSLCVALEETGTPLAEATQTLETTLARRASLESVMREARAEVETAEGVVRSTDEDRQRQMTQVQGERETLQRLREESRDTLVLRKTVEGRLDATGQALDALLARLGSEAEADAWAEKIEALQRRIARLGPINLAAIEEHEQHAERKHYLDAQHADLEEALATLDTAIQKIDRETRTRFRETFERVDEGLGRMFPRLFGGGAASLQLTGEDLLGSGVTLMARPPGKRNTSIAALSGGEKSLTAIALVFAIFELNPAPFCLLDEVDAPLDDANIGRFRELVVEMAKRVQLVLVTHNKITMEIAAQLVGITMNEPGVSRLVVVDVEEALEMARA